MAPRAAASFARALAAVALAWAAAGCRPVASASPWEESRPLAFRLTGTDGRVLENEPPGGRHLVVFFAASDDLRSLRQLELWEREARTFTNPPACIVVAMDRPDAWPLVRLFGERMAPRCAVVHALEELRDNGGPFAPVTWVPEVIVYDPLGHEVLRAPGGASGEAIAKAARAR
jgi:hypothetical protein